MVIGDLGDHVACLPTLASWHWDHWGDLTPWLAQLFVEPSKRRDGIGAALVHAILDRARTCGYDRVYLFTSGTLPEYYRRLGWREIDRLEYLARERTVMDYDVRAVGTRQD